MIWLLDPVRIVNAVGAELRGARERKRRKTDGKVEGRKSYAEANPELVKAAGKLRARLPRMSLREISAEPASSGLPFQGPTRNLIDLAGEGLDLCVPPDLGDVVARLSGTLWVYARLVTLIYVNVECRPRMPNLLRGARIKPPCAPHPSATPATRSHHQERPDRTAASSCHRWSCRPVR
jgi:hypothetical protein